MRSEKLQDKYAYVPRAMRAERAAAYLDISKSMFLQWVAEGKMPKGTRIGGLRIWDREDIDAAYEAPSKRARAISTIPSRRIMGSTTTNKLKYVTGFKDH